jgi:type II pantothenate kinase
VAEDNADMSSEDESFGDYSKNHGLDTLYSELAGALDAHRPADPISFLCDYFDNRKFMSKHASKENSQNLEVGCFVKRDTQTRDIPDPARAQPQAIPPTSPSKTSQKRKKDSVPTPKRPQNLDVPMRKIFDQRSSFFSFDIGGSLCKICILCPYEDDMNFEPSVRKRAMALCEHIRQSAWGELDKEQTILNEDGSELHFGIGRSSDMEVIIRDLHEHGFIIEGSEILATGGGAYKYAEKFTAIPNVRLKKLDELWTLLRGMNFLLENVADEAYCFTGFEPNQVEIAHTSPCTWTNRNDLYPYILVNIGSGCSILKVDGPTTFTRVSGTCIGGGTYWGLVKALCSPDSKMSAQTAFQLALGGTKTNVDMCVKDIYGGDYKKFNLSGDTVAAAFGKVAVNDEPFDIQGHSSDVARSLLDMIGMNIAQLAYLNARRFNSPRIVFAGNFLRHNDLTSKALAYSIHYWSKNSMEAAFLKHEGYFGTCGALMGNETEDGMTPKSHILAHSPKISGVPGPASLERLQELRHKSLAERELLETMKDMVLDSDQSKL